MPTIARASDGHWFLRRAFSEDNELTCATYQVSPRGEQVLDYFRPGDGDPICLELFYALLLDGGVYAANTPEDVSVFDLPNKYHPPVAEGDLTPFLRTLVLTPRFSFMHVIDNLHRSFDTTRLSPKQVTGFAAILFLAAKRREAQDQWNHAD
jgi:hypothetical protein